MPFQKGQSGNPYGRGILSKEFQRKCREHGPKIEAMLVAMVDGTDAAASPGDRIKAAGMLLSYGFGRPPAGDMESRKLKLEVAKLEAELKAIEAAKQSANDLHITWSTTAPVTPKP